MSCHSYRIGRLFPIGFTEHPSVEIARMLHDRYPEMVYWLRSTPRRAWRWHLEDAIDRDAPQQPLDGLLWVVTVWVVFEDKADAALFAIFFDGDPDVCEEAIPRPIVPGLSAVI